VTPTATAASTAPATPVWTGVRRLRYCGRNRAFRCGLLENSFLRTFRHFLLGFVRLFIRKF
jgi:hypothetical protein